MATVSKTESPARAHPDIDETCPPTGVYAAYNALKVKDKDACHGLLRGHGG